jgi:beta-adrenergic-receptor kinase
VEGEVLKLGGPFLQAWQKKHLKLYPNRLEFYHKNRDGQIVFGKGVEVKCTFTFCSSVFV